MDNREILITNKELIKSQHKCEHEPYEYNKYEITKRSIGSQCYVAIYEIPPQKSNYPYHYHAISVGDIIVCPPSEQGAHRIINTSLTEMLVYLDFDTINSPEVVFYPNSDKVGIIVHGESSTFYKRNINVDYYEGE